MSMSLYLQNKLLDATVGNVAYTTPTTVYLALSSVDITGNTSPTEPTGNNYSRQSVSFSAAANGVITNSSTATFSATGNAWPTVTAIAVMDASTGGNVLYYDNIPPRTVTAGQSLIFVSGRVTISLN